MKRLMMGMLVIALITSLLLVGCAKPAPAPAPTTQPTVSKPTAASPAPATSPTAIAKPASPAPASVTAAEFYKKNVVETIYAGAAGATYHSAAGLFALFWSEATGGTMRVSVKPGGAGVPGVNDVWDAKPDGLTLGFGPIGSRVTGPVAFKAPGVKFQEADKFTWIGAFIGQPYLLAIRADLPYKSMADLKKAKGLKFGATGKTMTASIGAALISELFGLDAKVITGFAGVEDVGLATGRGEIDGYHYTDSSVARHLARGWVKTPLVCTAEQRSVVYPDVPTIPEVMTLSPEQKDLLETYWTLYPDGGGLYGTPGIPEDRAKFLRDSFDKIMKTKEFKDMGTASWGSFSIPQNGDQVKAIMVRLKTLSQAKIDRLNAVVDKYTVALK